MLFTIQPRLYQLRSLPWVVLGPKNSSDLDCGVVNDYNVKFLDDLKTVFFQKNDLAIQYITVEKNLLYTFAMKLQLYIDLYI